MEGAFAPQTDLRLNKFIEQMANQLNGQPYNMVVQVYSENFYIPVARKCFAFMFTNIGDTPATVKGMIIFPSATPATALGDSRSISGHKLDIYTGTMDLSFRPPIGVNQAVEIVQLYYVD
jgi:urease beta subunit